jgi:hypothetical protein
MEHVHEDVHGRRYYWEYIKRFGKESSQTWWKDFVISLLIAVIPTALAWGDRTVLQGALLTVEAVGLLFGIVALRHLIHTSLILFRERAHPEYGGVRYTHWGYGVWGASILLALVAGLTYGPSHGWLRKPPPVALQVPAPTTPTITTSQVITAPQAVAVRETKIVKPSLQTGASKAPAPNTVAQTPSQTPAQAAGSAPPATFLDRVVQENRGLTVDDRNRLSTELYECDQFIKHGQGVGYKLNAEFGRLANDRQSGALANNVDDHIKLLRDLDTPAWNEYHGLQHLQEKWQYFPDQTEYVFGDNPFNAGEGSLVNAVEGITNSLNSWSKISNRNQQEILNFEAQPQVDFEKDLRQFFDWSNATLQRIKQMRQSLDPNGVVQPIPQNTTAPAPAMFSLNRPERGRPPAGCVRMTKILIRFIHENVACYRGTVTFRCLSTGLT